MIDIRQTILDQLKKNSWTINHFAKQVEGKVGRRTVYDYLQGGVDVKLSTVLVLLEAAGLTITITKRAKQPGKEKKQ